MSLTSLNRVMSKRQLQRLVGFIVVGVTLSKGCSSVGKIRVTIILVIVELAFIQMIEFSKECRQLLQKLTPVHAVYCGGCLSMQCWCFVVEQWSLSTTASLEAAFEPNKNINLGF